MPANVKFFRGTKAQYTASVSKDLDSIYFLDNGEMYLGTQKLNNAVVFVDSLPVQDIMTNTFYMLPNGELNIYNENMWTTITYSSVDAIEEDTDGNAIPNVTAIKDYAANKTTTEQALQTMSDEIDHILDGTMPITIPIASDTKLGGVMVGQGLQVTEDGTLSVVGGGTADVDIATEDTPGIVKPGANMEVEVDGTLNVTLPVATANAVGVVKPGNGLEITPDGTLSVNATVDIPIATNDSAGVVKPGEHMSVEEDGSLNVELPVATQSTVGVIKPGTNLTIEGDGTLNATATPVNVATSTEAGIVKPGTNMNVTGDGTLNVTIPVATNTIVGGVKQGTGVEITADGTLNVTQAEVPIATEETVGTVKPGTGLKVDEEGALSIDTVTTGTVMWTQTITLPTASWTGDVAPYSQNVAISNIDESYSVISSPVAANRELAANNQVRCTAVNDGSVTYQCYIKPLVDIQYDVMYFVAANAASNFVAANAKTS